MPEPAAVPPPPPEPSNPAWEGGLTDEECLWLYSQALLFEIGHHAGLQVFGQMKCMFIQGYVASKTAHPQEPYQPTTTSRHRAAAWYAGRDLFLRRLNPSPFYQNKKAEIEFVRCEESLAKRPYVKGI